MMRLCFAFDDDDSGYWVDSFTSAPSVGDTVSFNGVWYCVTEVRWVIENDHSIKSFFVNVFTEKKQEQPTDA